MTILAAMPVKPFGVAKARLAPVIDDAGRSHLGRLIAQRTAAVASKAGAEVVIVTADPGVADWSRTLGYDVVLEDRSFGTGLNGAAACAVAEAGRRGTPWAIIHADLPTVSVADLARVFAAAPSRTVLAPSHDGGTNVIAGHSNRFRFRYGPGSFRRHLAEAPRALVATAPGLALDLDTPPDLMRAMAMDPGFRDAVTLRTAPSTAVVAPTQGS